MPWQGILQMRQIHGFLIRYQTVVGFVITKWHHEIILPAFPRGQRFETFLQQPGRTWSTLRKMHSLMSAHCRGETIRDHRTDDKDWRLESTFAFLKSISNWNRSGWYFRNLQHANKNMICILFYPNILDIQMHRAVEHKYRGILLEAPCVVSPWGRNSWRAQEESVESVWMPRIKKPKMFLPWLGPLNPCLLES